MNTSKVLTRRGRTFGPAENDADIVALITARRWHTALCMLVHRHGRAVHRYCRAQLRHDDQWADDVRQEVFLHAFRDLPTFVGRGTVRSWLLGIARHRVLDHARAEACRRRLSEAHQANAVLERPPAVDEQLERARLHAALGRSLSTLSQPVRTAVALRFENGLSYQRIAALCDEQAGTVQARVSRALPKLRASLASCDPWAV